MIFADVRRRPKRPTWLSSEHRHISTIPPVLTPAEQAAMRAREGGQDAAPAQEAPAGPLATAVEPGREVTGDPETTQAIDRAAEEGATPYPEEHPPTEVREVPPGDSVDGDGRA